MPNRNREPLRPRRFADIVGNASVVARLQRAIVRGRLPRLLLITGPTGCGKTTLGRLIARRHLCPTADGQFEPCGQETCPVCGATFDDYLCDMYQYTEAGGRYLTEDFLELRRSQFVWEDHVFFFDEIQEANSRALEMLKKLVEIEGALVMMATTHAASIPDALMNRLRAAHYILSRPTPEEVADSLERACLQLGVDVESREQLLRIANHEQCSMRPCAQYPRKALGEFPDGRITQAALDEAWGCGQVTAEGPDASLPAI